jgi:hypothetical protein
MEDGNRADLDFDQLRVRALKLTELAREFRDYSTALRDRTRQLIRASIDLRVEAGRLRKLVQGGRDVPAA